MVSGGGLGKLVGVPDIGSGDRNGVFSRAGRSAIVTGIGVTTAAERTWKISAWRRILRG